MSGLAFQPGTFDLYGVGRQSTSPIDFLLKIDTETSATTEIGAFSTQASSGNIITAMTFSSTGVLYSMIDQNLVIVDILSGNVTPLGNVSGNFVGDFVPTGDTITFWKDELWASMQAIGTTQNYAVRVNLNDPESSSPSFVQTNAGALASIIIPYPDEVMLGNINQCFTMGIEGDVVYHFKPSNAINFRYSPPSQTIDALATMGFSVKGATSKVFTPRSVSIDASGGSVSTTELIMNIGDGINDTKFPIRIKTHENALSNSASANDIVYLGITLNDRKYKLALIPDYNIDL